MAPLASESDEDPGKAGSPREALASLPERR